MWDGGGTTKFEWNWVIFQPKEGIIINKPIDGNLRRVLFVPPSERVCNFISICRFHLKDFDKILSLLPNCPFDSAYKYP